MVAVAAGGAGGVVRAWKAARDKSKLQEAKTHGPGSEAC